MSYKDDPNELIHCDVCGEDFSTTYRRCPFCGEKPKNRPAPRKVEEEKEDTYVFDGQDVFDEAQSEEENEEQKGGKRLARRSAAPNPARIVTFVLSLLIIVAALVIVFTVISPKVHTNRPSEPSNPGTPSTGPVVSDTPTDPVNTDAPGEKALTALHLADASDNECTLKVGESRTIGVITDPVDWEGELTWASSNEECATVDENGTVTNHNPQEGLLRVTITVSGGDQTLEVIVYCRGTDAPDDAPPVTPSNPVDTDDFPSGTTGTIIEASDGLRVRSGPGTTYEVLASLKNGNQINVLGNAGDGWLKVSFQGTKGSTITGYVKSDYVKIN